MPTSIVCDREEKNMIEKSSQQDFRRVIGSIRGRGKDHHEMNQELDSWNHKLNRLPLESGDTTCDPANPPVR